MHAEIVPNFLMAPFKLIFVQSEDQLAC